jgi:hypothetical protein
VGSASDTANSVNPSASAGANASASGAAR